MDFKEEKQISLNYSSNVPEWNLALKHEAIARLSQCVSALNEVVFMILHKDCKDRLDPKNFNYGLQPDGFESAIIDAQYTLGNAAFALELLASQTPFPETMTRADAKFDASYLTNYARLKEICIRHGADFTEGKDGQ